MILVIISYVLVGIAVAFMTAAAFGMAASAGNITGYLGFLYRCGAPPWAMILTLLGIVAAWPLHILLILVAR